MQRIKKKVKAYLSVLLCVAMCATGMAGFAPIKVSAAESDDESIHVYADTPGDVESTKYTLMANGTKVPVIKYQANGNNFDIARFSSDDAMPEYIVSVPNEEIKTVTVYPERYYQQDSLKVSEDKHSVTFTLSDQLRYCFVMINGGPADQAGKPYLAIINDPTETDKPDVNASNVLNFQEFMEEYLSENPNSEKEKAEPAGITSGGVSYAAGRLVDNSTSQVRFPDKRKMTDDDATYALQAALDEIYKEGSSYDTLYFPAGIYTYSGLEIRNRNGKQVTIYVEEGALLKNRIQECMQAMEPAIGIWDSSDITISGRGIFDGNGVENYKKDRHDAKDSCHQGGVMIVRSSNITFNDTYVRDTKQWNWESHGSKNCTLNNVKGLTPYNQPWIDGLNMASAQNMTINGALTLGNDDNFASGHYNPSDGFTNTVPGYDQYNSDCLEWDTEDSFNISVNNTLGWSYSGGNGVRMGANTYGHQMKNYSFTNVNTTNFTGGGRGITVQNSTGTYPRYEEITFVNCSFDTTRVGRNFQILGKANTMIDTVTLENCWFSNGDAVSEAQNIKNLTIKDLYVGGKKVEVSSFANLTTQNVTNFDCDWEDNQAPKFTAPRQSSFKSKVGETISFDVAATDADGDTVVLSVARLPEGAQFDESTGAFSWTPSDDQMGTFAVTFAATDSKDVKAEKRITFTISDKVGNTAPEIAEFEGAPYSVKVGETLTFMVNATDKDGDSVTLSADDRLPTGAAFDAKTGKFTWKPSVSQTGVQEITFKAVDKWGATSQATVMINVDSGEYTIVVISAAEDTYLASWKDEKKNNYEGNEYLRVRRMNSSADNFDSYGLWGEKITSTSDAGDAKISVLKFDATELKKNLANLEKAELELTLINRRDNTSTGKNRLMAAEVTDEWSAADATWLTYPAWNTDSVKYSEEFAVDTNASVKNNVGITASSYDGTKVVIDVTEFVKNLTDEDTTLSLAVCDEKGYELAFASTEGAAKLDAEKAAAPIMRLTVKKELGPEVAVGQLPVSEDSFVGSWSGDQTKNFGSSNFLRVSYGSDSQGVLGTESGGDNKVTYLKFDLSELDVNEFDRAKLQFTLLGVRYNAAANQNAEILVGVAEEDWTESGLTWKNKPQVTTDETGLAVSEVFKLGSVVHNDPAQITTPDGAVGTVDVTEFVKAAKEAGKTSLTFVVNISDSNSVMTEANANRIYFVSKEGARNYANATDMAPTLLLTKYDSAEEFAIVNQPEDTSARSGENVSFTVEATGTGLTYQWQYSNANSSKWYNSSMTGSNTDTVTVSVGSYRDGQKYRCVITNASGEILTSEVAVMTMEVSKTLKIVSEPSDYAGDVDDMAVFTVKAEGDGLTYQWQYSNANSKKWFNSAMSGNDTDTISVPIKTYRDGQKYRCIITDAEGYTVTTDTVVMEVKNN